MAITRRRQDETAINHGKTVGLRKMDHSICELVSALGFSRTPAATVWQVYKNFRQTLLAREKCWHFDMVTRIDVHHTIKS